MIRLILAALVFMVPTSVAAVYFPGGIDWTHPSQASYVQSLYLNVLGRAATSQEAQQQVRNLRRNDNRISRLRLFESLLASDEYKNSFDRTDREWQIFRAPDKNYSDGFWRYKAGKFAPAGFTAIPGAGRGFTQNIARSVALYYDAYCYKGEPCTDNPQQARDRDLHGGTNTVVSHACSDPGAQTTQYKWVAVNGTTFPRGIGGNTICMDNFYFQISQLQLQRYDCNTNFSNCRRNAQLDLRASRKARDNAGNEVLVFNDGSRLIHVKQNQPAIAGNNQTNPTVYTGAHECADPKLTTSRFAWNGPNRSAESKGVGAGIVCMDNHYYKISRLTLARFNCDRGYTNCRADPKNDLVADGRTRVNGKAALSFANGTTLALIQLNGDSARTTPARPQSNQTQRRNNTTTQPRQTPQNRSRTQVGNGRECANPVARVSQFRWKSNGLSSWPDGVAGRFICLPNAYYEIDANRLRHYNCSNNYTNCTANAGKDLIVTRVSDDGNVRTLNNGDEITLISR